jgi:tRNA threonylcarbamoyladenosine biosynthesis protein TsaB
MLVLSLDTSSAAGSAAVVRDGDVVVERAGDATRTHGERLPGELMAALDAAGCTLNDVDLFAVATGPGSFTGLRVGIATIQGIAFARQARVVPVSTFEALAGQMPGDTPLGVWLDAHRGQVFATLLDAEGRELQAPSSRPPEATLDAWARVLPAGEPVRFAGDGAVKYRGTIAGRLGAAARIADAVPLLAGTIGRVAAAHPERAVAPHALAPLYVRRPDAELARDRRPYD